MIKSILDQISNESSTLGKLEILKQNSENELLKRVLYLGISKRVNYHIKKIPSYNKSNNIIDLNTTLNGLDLLINRDLTGHAGIEHLSKLLSNLSDDDADVLERIIKKDLKIGIGESVNKSIANLIEITPYMGAQSFSNKKAKRLFESGEKIKSDVKMDGRYGNGIIISNNAEIVSRQGEKTFLEGSVLIEELSKLNDCVLIGELTIKNTHRYRANGMISSIIDINKKISDNIDASKSLKKFEKENNISYEEALNRIVYTCWDTISIEDYFNVENNEPYHIRWEKLKNIVSGSKHIQLVEYKMIESYEEALSHFLEIIERGDEGTIIKTMDGVWKDSKPWYQLKVKLEISVDLKIIGFEYGKKGTKNEKWISTLICESSDGLVRSNASGMKEKMMKHITENQDILLNTIVEVRCCGLSQNKNGDYALLHPSVVVLRDDKNTCDDLNSIKEIEEMSKSLK